MSSSESPEFLSHTIGLATRVFGLLGLVLAGLICLVLLPQDGGWISGPELAGLALQYLVGATAVLIVVSTMLAGLLSLVMGKTSAAAQTAIGLVFLASGLLTVWLLQ